MGHGHKVNSIETDGRLKLSSLAPPWASVVRMTMPKLFYTHRKSGKVVFTVVAVLAMAQLTSLESDGVGSWNLRHNNSGPARVTTFSANPVGSRL